MLAPRALVRVRRSDVAARASTIAAVEAAGVRRRRVRWRCVSAGTRKLVGPRSRSARPAPLRLLAAVRRSMGEHINPWPGARCSSARRPAQRLAWLRVGEA